MRMSSVRAVLAAAALAALLVSAGCASASPRPGATASGPASPPSHDHLDVTPDHLDIAWLEGGAAIGIVTWGSSTPTCRPGHIEATAEGQTVTVVLHENPKAGEGCDADLTPRGDLIALPAGVDSGLDVEVDITYGAITGTLTLPGLEDAPVAGSGEPSAGWFSADGIVLLTWGSGSCRPHVDDVQLTDAAIETTLETPAGMCTADFSPRVTPILLPQHADQDAALELIVHMDGDLLALPILG